MAEKGSRWETFGGLGLMGLGVVFLADELFQVSVTGALWPLVIIGVGVYLLVGTRPAGKGA
jgi:hypothetical protein